MGRLQSAARQVVLCGPWPHLQSVCVCVCVCVCVYILQKFQNNLDG